MELPVEQNLVSTNEDIQISRLREVLDLWYDNQILFVNDDKFDTYKTLPNLKLLDEKTSTINTIVEFITDFSENPDNNTETGVSKINFLSYSFETNELRLENILFGKIDNFSRKIVSHTL